MENKPKKSLGQNFLRDEQVLQKIITVAELNSEDFVIEIGPGEGVLTEQLAKHTKKVIAIELDDRLIPVLNEKFKNTANVEIVHADILNINLPELLGHWVSKGTPSVPISAPILNYKLVANIPYYITSPIIRLFLEQVIQPKEIILMVQKEVAKRIVATAGQMSLLSVAIQYYAEVKILFEVSKDSFFPIPKVDSAIIKITPIRKFNKITDKKFFRVVKAGFSAKRKTLPNNLGNSLQLDKKDICEKLKTLSLHENVRAQELTIVDWKKVSELILS
jgi:16S rRNA (adenine1518-N6/adenine1519-N6)-dimethyltransferase